MAIYAVPTNELDKLPLVRLSRKFSTQDSPAYVSNVTGPFYSQEHAETWAHKEIQREPTIGWSIVTISEPLAVLAAKPYEIEVEITRSEPDGQE